MKRVLLSLFLVSLTFAKVFANEIYNSAPGFTVPDGAIAYLGSVYAPIRVWKTNDTKTWFKLTIVSDVPPAAKAVSETQAALLKNASNWKFSVEAAPASNADQVAIVTNLLFPNESQKHPPLPLEKLQALAGGKPYALIVLIDHYELFTQPVRLRETLNGEKMNYFPGRAVLESDKNEISNGSENRVGAFEFFLISTKDGSLVWKATGCNSIQFSPFNSYWDTVNHEMDEFFKHLAGKN